MTLYPPERSCVTGMMDRVSIKSGFGVVYLSVSARMSGRFGGTVEMTVEEAVSLSESLAHMANSAVLKQALFPGDTVRCDS